MGVGLVIKLAGWGWGWVFHEIQRGVGWVMQGWGESYWDGVGHAVKQHKKC